MKLEPKAKHVRIRIKSGGEEHFSLDSLKRNFSVQDLWEAVRGKSLYRWLRQQNENELADNVDAYRKIEKPTIEEYVGFSALFFKDNGLTDVNSLIEYYKSKELQKNLQYVLVYVFDSLDYEKGKTWFQTHRGMKRDEDWVNFFEHRLNALKDMDVVDCHKLLADLYDGMGNTTKKVFHLKKASAQLNIMAESNGELLPNLLEIGDYQCVKSLFDDPAIQSKVETKKWIEAFRRCKDSLFGQEQGECLYILSTLYEKAQEHDMSKMCLKMSANNGYKKAKDILNPPSKYPELTAIRESYTVKITIDLLPAIENRLSDLVDEIDGNEYYETCRNCLIMFRNIVANYSCRDLDKAIAIRNSTAQTQSITELPLVYLVAGLAWEEKRGNTAMYRQNGTVQLPFDYDKVFRAKNSCKEVVVKTAKGMQCNLLKDSPIDQMFFFMENYGGQFSFY